MPFYTVAPQKVTITGAKTAKVGENLNFECETGNSNPKALIQWVVDGRTLHDNYTHWVCIKFISYWIIEYTKSKLSIREIDYNHISTVLSTKCILLISA